MARATLTPKRVPGMYPAELTGDAAEFTWTPADLANKNAFLSTGAELLLVRNDDIRAGSISIKSVPNEFNRTTDIADYSVGAGKHALFGPFPASGWRQSDGTIHIDPKSPYLKLAVVRLF